MYKYANVETIRETKDWEFVRVGGGGNKLLLFAQLLKSALFQMLAYWRTGDKPLHEPMVINGVQRCLYKHGQDCYKLQTDMYVSYKNIQHVKGRYFWL